MYTLYIRRSRRCLALRSNSMIPTYPPYTYCIPNTYLPTWHMVWIRKLKTWLAIFFLSLVFFFHPEEKECGGNDSFVPVDSTIKLLILHCACLWIRVRSFWIGTKYASWISFTIKRSETQNYHFSFSQKHTQDLSVELSRFWATNWNSCYVRTPYRRCVTFLVSRAAHYH